MLIVYPVDLVELIEQEGRLDETIWWAWWSTRPHEEHKPVHAVVLLLQHLEAVQLQLRLQSFSKASQGHHQLRH